MFVYFHDVTDVTTPMSWKTSKTMVLQTSCRGGWQHSKANNLLIKPLKLVFKIGQNFPKALTLPCKRHNEKRESVKQKKKS